MFKKELHRIAQRRYIIKVTGKQLEALDIMLDAALGDIGMCDWTIGHEKAIKQLFKRKSEGRLVSRGSYSAGGT